MRRTIWTVLVVAVVSSSAFAGEEKIMLKQKYPPGTYVMTMTTDMKQEVPMGPRGAMQQDIKMLMVMELVAEPPGDDKSQKLHMTYKRIKMSMTGMAAMSYDSASTQEQPNPMFGSMFKGLIDAQIDVTLGPDGKVTDVAGMDKIWDAIVKANPGAAPMLDQVKKQFGKDMFSQMFSGMDAMLPTGPIVRGHTWATQKKQNLPMIGAVDLKQTFKLKEIRKTPAGRVAIIDFTGKMTTDESKPIAENPAMPVKFGKIQIDQTGTMKLNAETGMMTDVTMNQNMHMEMVIPTGPEGQEMNMAIKQQGTVNMTVTPGKYKPPTPMPTTAPAAEPVSAEKEL